MKQGYTIDDIRGALGMSNGRVREVMADAGLESRWYELMTGEIRKALTRKEFERIEKHSVYQVVTVAGESKLVLKKSIRDYPVMSELKREVKS